MVLAPTNEQFPPALNIVGIDAVGGVNKVKSFSSVRTSEIAAGGFLGDKDLTFTLAHNRDYLTRKFGDAVLKQMLRDAEVMKCYTVIKIGVLGDGVSFFPALNKPAPISPPKPGEVESPQKKEQRTLREEEIARYELAKQYSDFATRAVENLDKPLRAILDEMLAAIIFGNKLAEQTYEEVFDKTFNQTKFYLRSIRVKPRRSVAFVVDRFWKVIGFKSAYTVTVTAEDGTKRNEIRETILPREKFLLLTFRGEDEDPRGTSILEAVYNAWHLKTMMWPEYMRWLIQCAIPGLIGVLPPNEEKRYLRDENNEIVRDSEGNPIYENEVATMLNALTEMRNASAIVVPHGATVQPIQNSVSGDPFKGMRDILNEEIEMGMLLQTLATSEGRFMSRAAAQSHMSVLDLFIWYIKGLVMEMLRNDLLKPLFLNNFEDFDMELLPRVSMGDTERRDWATDLTAIAIAYKAGFIGESQKVGYDMIVSAPPRDIESDLEYDRQQAEQAALLKNPPQANDNTENGSTRNDSNTVVSGKTGRNSGAKPSNTAFDNLSPRAKVNKIIELKALFNEVFGEDL